MLKHMARLLSGQELSSFTFSSPQVAGKLLSDCNKGRPKAGCFQGPTDPVR